MQFYVRIGGKVVETKVVITTRELFVGDERIPEGTELMVSERDSEYYTTMLDCLPGSIKKKVRNGYPILIRRNYVTEPENIEDVNLDGLLSVLEVK